MVITERETSLRTPVRGRTITEATGLPTLLDVMAEIRD